MYGNLSRINPSVSVSFADFVRGLEASGRSIVKMQTGDPDFPTHPAVVSAAHDALLAGSTKYCDSRGLPSLREAVAAKLLGKNGIRADPGRNILITHGAVHAVGIAIRALVESGDEVVLMSPYWRAYEADVVVAGGIPVIVRASPLEGFRLEAQRVVEAFTPRTRAIVVNSPNNPSGAIYDERELRLLALAAAERGIHVISDEVYEDIIYDGRKHFSPGSVAEVARWVISVFSFSKSYAMTGWRVGYLCADQRIVDECLKVSQFSVTSLSPFAQAGAHAALAHDEVQAYAADMRARYQARRDYLVELTRGSWVEGALLSPQGAFYALIDCSSLCDDSYPLAQRLVMDHGVAFTPGLAFGDDMSRYLRLCFATAEPNIARAVDAITSAV